jgi:MSHA biogenesis protein MshM
MYLEHFGLREYPFSITPDTGFFFEYGHYRDALNTLLVAVRSGEGFVKVTGEVGTGKTLLCRKLLNLLEDEFHTAYIPNPYLSPTALTLAFAEEIGLNLPRDLGQHRIVKALTERIIELNAEGKRVVLCIDEAQAMPEQTLEALRLLTNLETEKRKLLQVVLFGQPELDQHLSQDSVRQVRQRITFSHRLLPIDRQGMEAYISHRMLIAGSSGGVRFEAAAQRVLYEASRGVPRLINILAHKSLMVAYGRGAYAIEPSHVRLAAADTEDVHQRRWLSGAVVAVIGTVLALAGAVFYVIFSGGSGLR